MSVLQRRSGHSHCLRCPRGLSGFRDLLVPAADSVRPSAQHTLLPATVLPALPPPPASVPLPLPPRSLPWLCHCCLRCPWLLSICHPGMSMAFGHRPEARSVLANLTRRRFTAWSCRLSGSCTQPALPPVSSGESGSSSQP